MDGSTPTKLGAENCDALSPDTMYAVCGYSRQPGPLVLLPTRSGTVKELADDHLFHSYTAGWLPDSKSIVFSGFEKGHLSRVYVTGLDGQAPRPLTPEGVVGPAVLSADGKQLAAPTASGELVVYPLDGSRPHTIPGTGKGEPIVGWGRDGKSVIIQENRGVPANLIRVDTATGKRQLWRTITPEETSGVFFVGPVVIGIDEKSYVYGISRRLTDLYEVEGLN
jgi:hypothetical protein